MLTQTSSKQRIKEDKVSDDDLGFLYEQHRNNLINVSSFRALCIGLIEQSSGKRTKKDEFIKDLNKTNSKDVMVIKVTNYMMAGKGLGV